VLAGLSSLPLLVLAGVIGVIGGVMTETGASGTVLDLQRWLVLFGAVGLLGAAVLGVIHAFDGSRDSFKAFVGFLVVSALLGLAAVLGFSTWCSDCGSS
jgi:hypothetical protein